MPATRSDRFAVILGTNEVASAVAVLLRRGGYGVVLSHDPLPPVIRRKMAFHDALFDDAVSVAGITAQRADTGLEIRASLGRAPGVVVTELGLLDLIVLRSLDILVDARMQKYLATPDLRRLARLTIGLGPGFCGGANCDVAIETRPDKAGQLSGKGRRIRPTGNRPALEITGANGSSARNVPAGGRLRSRSGRVSSRISSSVILAIRQCARRLTGSCEASFATGPRCPRA